MASLTEALDRVRFRVVSPDKSITLDADLRGSLEITFAEGTLGRHSARSFARQLEAVLGSVRAAHQHAWETVYERELGTAVAR